MYARPLGSRSDRGATRWRTDVLTGCSAPTTGVGRTIRHPIPVTPATPSPEPPHGAPLLPVPPCRREGSVVRATARNCTKFSKVRPRFPSLSRGSKTIFSKSGFYREANNCSEIREILQRGASISYRPNICILTDVNQTYQYMQ